MDDDQPRFQFHLSQLLGITLAVAMLLGAYRANWELFLLAMWLAYSASLVCVMRLFKWSDIAMSVCFLLILLPLVIAFLLPTVRS